MSASNALPLVLPLAVPLVYALAAVLPVRASRDRAERLWRRCAMAAALAFAAALGSALALAAGGLRIAHLAIPVPFDGSGPLRLGIRLDALTAVLLVLVTFIGLVILRYSHRYLDGDAGRTRYVRWLLATLAAVTTLVTANHLALLWLAWLGASLALHQLLTYYADRPTALIAAHKKFISSRLADVCLLVGFVLLARAYGTAELDLIFAGVAGSAALPAGAEVAAVLLAVAAALKCAQLPFHGWLIQVMEAPTPVSALLHAGVVNIGGFLMIRLAPLMAQAGPAQTVLVVLGSATAVLASLVMTTRVSIKVALAWSTCAQMGFMLLECGLGAYALALLHLVAHSLYKAHAFLASGSTAETWRAQALAAPPARVGLASWLVGGAISLLALTAFTTLVDGDPRRRPADFVLVGIVAAAATPLVARSLRSDLRRALPLLCGALLLATAYLAWHAIVARLVDAPQRPSDGFAGLRVAIVALAFGLLFVVQGVLEARPTGRLARALYPPLFAGFHLDELFTRLTFRIWPARPPAAPPPLQAVTLGAREQESPR